MTLRTRLVLVFVGIAVIFLGGLLAVGIRQQQVLTNQVDDQLSGLARNAWRLDRQGPVGPPPGIGAGPLLPAGAYVGRLEGDALETLARDGAQPAPRLSAGEVARNAPGPFTAPAEEGGSGMRVVALSRGTGWTVVALSRAQVDTARRQLALTGGIALLALMAALSLLLWWVNRLGLRPIADVTAVTEQIAGGELDRRVAGAAPGTEAGRLASAFNAMADARQDAEDRLRRFVADASHELRTPLTTLQGYTDLHAAGGLADEDAVTDAFRRIGQEAGRMRGLVDDLLLLASLDERRPLDLGPVDISQVVRDAGSDGRAVQPERPVSVEAPGAVWALADAQRITQVVTALVANALRHTPPEVAIALSARVEGDRAVVTIRDTGPGIAAEHLPHVFERFYRADSGRGRGRGGGSGLGLSIVKAIVEAHGGRIAIESEPGSGTTATFDLPATPAT